MSAAPTGLSVERGAAAHAELTELNDRTVMRFCLDGRAAGSSGAAEAQIVERALVTAGQLGTPVIGVVRSIALDPGSEGLEALVAWGGVARTAVRLSGTVPLLLAVTGPVHGSLAPLLGLADHVVMTAGASAYVNGPGPVRHVTAEEVTAAELGGAAVHSVRSGLAALVATDEQECMAILGFLVDHLPDNYLGEPPLAPPQDPPQRSCEIAARVVPQKGSVPYDIRTVIEDVCDRESFVELHPDHAPNVVCGYGRLGGRAVGILANQPAVRAGTLDIEASRKLARHVQLCDSMGVAIITFIDTPGYEPGRDLEWRGMIRHGAKLVAAYGRASVPRLGVILRKAYGGAYIVMDSKTMGNDLMLAWPSAEIAIMGAQGAVSVLHRRELAAAEDPQARRAELEAEYRRRHLSPRAAAGRGLVDEVIDPRRTREKLADALGRFTRKQSAVADRRHDNPPL